MAVTRTPKAGDRSAHDVENFPELHASDLEAGTPIHHVPAGLEVGDVLVWNGTQWVPEAIGGVGGSGSGGMGANYLQDLLDVDIPAPEDGQILTYDDAESKWVAEDPAVPAGSYLEILDGYNQITNMLGMYTFQGTPLFCLGSFQQSGSIPNIQNFTALGAHWTCRTGTTLGNGSGFRTARACVKRTTGGYTSGFNLWAWVSFPMLTNVSCFVGFSTGVISDLGNTDNPAGSHVGFWFRPSPSALAHTNIMIMSKDGTTLSADDSGVAAASDIWYEIRMSCAPGGSAIDWSIKNMTTSAIATGSKSTHLPAAATLLYPQFGVVSQLGGAARDFFVKHFYGGAIDATTP